MQCGSDTIIIPSLPLKSQGVLKEPLLFRAIPDRFKRQCELEQASRLRGVAIGKRFNLWPQHYLPRFVPVEVSQKPVTGSLDLI